MKTIKIPGNGAGAGEAKKFKIDVGRAAELSEAEKREFNFYTPDGLLKTIEKLFGKGMGFTVERLLGNLEPVSSFKLLPILENLIQKGKIIHSEEPGSKALFLPFDSES